MGLVLPSQIERKAGNLERASRCRFHVLLHAVALKEAPAELESILAYSRVRREIQAFPVAAQNPPDIALRERDDLAKGTYRRVSPTHLEVPIKWLFEKNTGEPATTRYVIVSSRSAETRRARSSGPTSMPAGCRARLSPQGWLPGSN